MYAGYFYNMIILSYAKGITPCINNKAVKRIIDWACVKLEHVREIIMPHNSSSKMMVAFAEQDTVAVAKRHIVIRFQSK